MNFKKQAKKLESFLDGEFSQKMPVAILDDGNLLYKDFKIKQNKIGKWTLRKIKGFELDQFNLKACALIGARYYKSSTFDKYDEIKMLDELYFKHFSDAQIFRNNYEKTKDVVRKDTSLWRWEIASSRARYAKHQIVTKFKILF